MCKGQYHPLLQVTPMQTTGPTAGAALDGGMGPTPFSAWRYEIAVRPTLLVSSERTGNGELLLKLMWKET
jgi:hypothetical protein